MKASFRNCRERWVFSICREQDKTANRMGKKMMWLSHGHLMAQFGCTMLLLILKKRIVYQWENVPSRISLPNAIISWGLYVFYLIFTVSSIIFQKKEITVLLMMEWNHSYSWRSVFMHLHFHKICIKFCIIRIVQRFFISKY